jgi:hypothetical protein
VTGGVQTPPAFDEWCIVEPLGHRRLAARVREVTLAGAGMLRLDEPATATTQARTQYVSPGSVYALHPTTEQVVTTMCADWASEPVSRWDLKRAAELERQAYDADPDAVLPAAAWSETLDDEEI